MLSSNGIVLNYAIVMYDRSKSKVKIVQEIADELPVPPVVSYFLCDSWYTCGDIMDAFIKKGFYTIGVLKTNRVLYPCGIKQKVSELALHLRKTDASLRTREILDIYVERWPVEVFFRQSKDRLAFDRYRVRSSQGIRRYWL